MNNNRQPDDRTDMNNGLSPVLVCGLKIIAGSPASLAGKDDFAPAIAIQAPTDGERGTGRNSPGTGILRARPGPNIHIARRIGIGRFRQ